VLLKALHNVVRYLIALFFAKPLAQSANKLAHFPSAQTPLQIGNTSALVRIVRT
jgi:hypothetical protein